MAYELARQEGASSADALAAASRVLPKGDRHLARIVARHRSWVRERLRMQAAWQAAQRTLVQRIAAGEFAELIAAAIKAAPDDD